ncbi:hypothetical protein ACFY5F_08800 [Streptomyces sp. NPDC013161]|uniref:hypothetical protein n=1 Tax=Streptomyces sp. NPDC013161 TaxID=3364862 RepID=UPI003673E8B1
MTRADTARYASRPEKFPPASPDHDFGDRLFAERPDGVFVTARHPGPALPHHVNPRLGLREGDFAAPAEFAAAVRA